MVFTCFWYSAQCMLGRRGQFEVVADWLPVLPLWVEPTASWSLVQPPSCYATKPRECWSLCVDVVCSKTRRIADTRRSWKPYKRKRSAWAFYDTRPKITTRRPNLCRMRRRSSALSATSWYGCSCGVIPCVCPCPQRLLQDQSLVLGPHSRNFLGRS